MKFSIITCTKNSEKYLGHNIKSVTDQNFDDFEHIFIDGQSADKTINIIGEYKSKFPNRVKLHSYPPKGIADAMNKGIENAKGEYIIHLHSDDYLYDKNVLNDVSAFLEKNDPDWIYGNEMRVGSLGQEIGLFSNKKIFELGCKSVISRYLLKYFDFIRHQSVFVKKDVFEKFGYFDSKFDIAMDYEYWLRIKDKTKWIFFNRTINCFRMHDEGTSSSPQSKTKMYLDEMLASREYMNWIEFNILRPIFKVIIYSLAEIEKQIRLYKTFNRKH